VAVEAITPPAANNRATATAILLALLLRFPHAGLFSEVATHAPSASLQIDLKNLFIAGFPRRVVDGFVTRNELAKQCCQAWIKSKPVATVLSRTFHSNQTSPNHETAVVWTMNISISLINV
jgi:hypothetical protein